MSTPRPTKPARKKSDSNRQPAAKKPKGDGHEIRDEQPRVHFDCEKCPAFCCSIYERVQVTDFDLKRMAKHFKLPLAETEKRYTKWWDKQERILKRKRDPILGETCEFLDLKTRGCTIYPGRPEACRDYPERKRCVYYDVYKFEQRHQGDSTVMPIFRIEFKEWDQQKKEEEIDD